MSRRTRAARAPLHELRPGQRGRIVRIEPERSDYLTALGTLPPTTIAVPAGTYALGSASDDQWVALGTLLDGQPDAVVAVIPLVAAPGAT